MGRRKSSVGGGSECDTESLGSLEHGSRASGGGRRGRSASEYEEEVLEVDPFDAAVEQLYEKRASTRERGLATIISLLSQFSYDECAFREETLTQMFMGSIRKGKEMESQLAAKALGLHVLTLGASTATEGIYQEAEPLLEQLVLSGRSSVARVAGVDVLSLLCFVASEGTTDTLRTMHTLWRVVLEGWKKAAAAPVVVAALRGWAFLLTTVPSYGLDAHFVETRLGLLAQLLNGSDVDVRGAAGEAIALLWQIGDLNSLPESPRTSRSENNGADSLVALAVGSPRSPRLAAAFAAQEKVLESSLPADQQHGLAPLDLSQQPQHGQSPAPQRQDAAADNGDAAVQGGEQQREEEEEEDQEVDSLEAIVERMRDLAKNRGDASRLNKGDRASSRSTFRDLLAIVQGEYVPEQKIKLRHGDILLVTGLVACLRLNYLRAFLADAFQSHMQVNPLLHEVFEYSPATEREEKLTPLEKRMFRSKSSTDVRDRTELRRKARSQMTDYRHAALADY